MVGMEAEAVEVIKKIPVPFQLPSTIYEPSLITPHYGINDRQLINPLTATDLITPFIQSLISNQTQNINKTPPQVIPQEPIKVDKIPQAP